MGHSLSFTRLTARCAPGDGVARNGRRAIIGNTYLPCRSAAASDYFGQCYGNKVKFYARDDASRSSYHAENCLHRLKRHEKNATKNHQFTDFYRFITSFPALHKLCEVVCDIKVSSLTLQGNDDMTGTEILIPFAQGVARQAAALESTCERAQAWLDTLDITALRGGTLLFAGIGASYAVLAAPVHELRAAGLRALRSNGDDMPDGTPPLADWYLGVSQSGRSPEVVRVLEQQRPGRRLALVNQADSPLAAVSADTLWLGTLIDSGMSSVALLATSVCLGLLTDALIGRDCNAGWRQLPTQLDAVRHTARAAVDRFAQQAGHTGCIDFVGGGTSLSAAEQGALLLREGPKMAAMGMGTRHYLHGMTDAVGHGTAHVLIGGEREILLAKQLVPFGVPILLVTDQAVSLPGTETVQLPVLPPLQRLALEILVMDLLAIALGRVVDRDIDAGVVARLDTKISGVVS
ncbi:hypothetical protein FS594_08070 [Rahnella aquatilis]|nr:hypothetical protein FS594_08070 [Rahnella aquatilis]